jgi:hypothetical protein
MDYLARTAAKETHKMATAAKPTAAKRQPPTTKEVLAQQVRDATRDLVRPPIRPPAAPGTPADLRQHYIDTIAPNAIAGRLIKFDKTGHFVTSDDGAEIDPDRDFVAMCDETQIGWIKFSGDDAPPLRNVGLLYDGFAMPPRESLGDDDPEAWSLGLSGLPEDPWLHQINLVLEDRELHELFTFSTTSKTGRRAVGNLLRHFDRMSRHGAADAYPIVRLRPGGFQHRDDRIGFVPTPSFAIVGQAPKRSADKPDSSPATDLNDSINF